MCGDGSFETHTDPVEECDDGNLVSGDGCNDSCTVENDYSCSGNEG